MKSVWLPNDSDAPDADPEARPGRLAPVLPQYATQTASGRRHGQSYFSVHAGDLNAPHLASWLKLADIDPNDPRNADMMELLRTREAVLDSKRLFRVGIAEEIKIGDGFTGKKREMLIKARWERGFRGSKPGDPADVLRKMIPVNERDIKLPDLERGVDGRLARELNDRFGASKNIVTAQALQLLEERNSLIKKYLTDVRARLRFSKVMEQNQQIQAIDVVKDIPLPVLSFDLDALTKLFAPRRKLRPQRQGPKVLAMHPDACSLVVNVESAQGLPVRSGDGALRPFVQAKFQGKNFTTNEGSSAAPIWNQQAELPVVLNEGAYSPANMMQCSDALEICVFDAFPPDTALSGEPEEKAPGRVTGRFLGRMSIPVNALYRAGVLKGAFRLELPPVLLGYKESSLHGAYVSLYITFKPQLLRPQEEDLKVSESDVLSRYTAQWLQDLRRQPNCSARPFRASALSAEGQPQVVTRFVCPIPVPPGHSAQDETGMRALAVMVSLIPQLGDLKSFQFQSSVWNICSSMVAMSIGDHVEHALLLCNYFLAAGHNAYVVLGHGLHRPRSAAVLTCAPVEGGPNGGVDEYGRPRLWSPNTGNVYAANAKACELLRVATVFNSQNVWANIQPSSAPWQMNWNLSNARDWQPFFTLKMVDSAPRTVQTVIHYSRLPNTLFLEIEATAEREIMDAINKARAKEFTRFNRRCSRALKGLLRECAKSRAAGKARPYELEPQETHARHFDQIQQLFRNHLITGFPLCFPFMDVNDIRRAVLSTGIHTALSPDVEFALATHVEYSGLGYVCAIWVYVVSLHRLQ